MVGNQSKFNMLLVALWQIIENDFGNISRRDSLAQVSDTSIANVNVFIVRSDGVLCHYSECEHYRSFDSTMLSSC